MTIEYDSPDGGCVGHCGYIGSVGFKFIPEALQSFQPTAAQERNWKVHDGAHCCI